MKGRIILISLSAILSALCIGCKAQQEIVRDTTYIYKDRVQFDSIYDSIYIHDSTIIQTKGDTIFVDRWHDRWHTNIEYHHDTIRDTIRTNTEVQVPIKEKGSNWWAWLMIGGSVVLLLVGYFERKKP